MENVFCAILSKYRLYQGIALYRSLNRHLTDLRIFILCVDDETYHVCNGLDLENVSLFTIDDINVEKLTSIQQSRKLNEYCWTLKPFFIQHIIESYSFIEKVAYLDADLYFYNDPTPIFESKKDYCVLLSEHDYQEKIAFNEEKFGKYNSGLMVFKKCDTSLDVLRWWADKCCEWCGSNAIPGGFGDQKYLDLMPSLFKGVYSITAPGINIGPWNERKYTFKLINGEVYANKEKLICYHFSGLRLNDKDRFSLLRGRWNSIVYLPYIKELQQIISHIQGLFPEFNGYFIESYLSNTAKLYKLKNIL